MGKSTTHKGRQPLVKQTVLFAEFAVANFDAQGANGVVNDLGLVGTKENQIAVFAPERSSTSAKAVMDIFDDRALQTITAFWTARSP
jgi:hypothetical protein